MFFLKKLFKMRGHSQGEEVKPFLDHLEDLRWTLMKIVFTMFGGMMICFSFRNSIFHFVEYPMTKIGMVPKEVLMVTSAPEIITASISLSFYASLVLTFPVLMFFLAQFILPALTFKEKKIILPAVAVGFLLFLIGATCCFLWILPPTLGWLRDETVKSGIRTSYALKEYFSFVSHLTIAFGLFAELPVVTVVLNRLGILSYQWLASTRMYAFTLILILSAIISPTIDVMMMLVLAAPIALLYELCIWLIWFLEKRTARQERNAK